MGHEYDAGCDIIQLRRPAFPINSRSAHRLVDGRQSVPAHLSDLLLADELMDTSVQGITGALQGLYEAGRVSYPRTDSHDLVARHQHSHTALHLLGTYGRPPAGSVGLALSAGHTHVSGGVTQQWQRDGGGASEEKPCMMCYSE